MPCLVLNPGEEVFFLEFPLGHLVGLLSETFMICLFSIHSVEVFKLSFPLQASLDDGSAQTQKEHSVMLISIHSEFLKKSFVFEI